MMRGGEKNAETAKRILANECGKLTAKQIAYLNKVIEQGEYAKKIVEDYDHECKRRG